MSRTCLSRGQHRPGQRAPSPPPAPHPPSVSLGTAAPSQAPRGGGFPTPAARLGKKSRRKKRGCVSRASSVFLPGCDAQPPPSPLAPCAMRAAAGRDAPEGPLDPGRELPLSRGGGSHAASQDKLFLIKGAESAFRLPPYACTGQGRAVAGAGAPWSPLSCCLSRPVVFQGQPRRRPSEGRFRALANTSRCSEEALRTPPAFSLPFSGSGTCRPSATRPRHGAQTWGDKAPAATALLGGIRGARGAWAEYGPGSAATEGSLLPPSPCSAAVGG